MSRSTYAFVSPVTGFKIHKEQLQRHDEGLEVPLVAADLVPGHDQPHHGVPPDPLELGGHPQVELRAAHQDELEAAQFSPLSAKVIIISPRA